MRATAKLQRAKVLRWQVAFVGLPAFALAGIFWFGTVGLIFALQSARCSARTFYSDSPAPQHVFVYVPVLFLALPVVSFVYGQGAALLRSWQNPLEGEALRRQKAGFRSAQRRYLKIFAIVLANTLPLSVGFSFCQFCLEPGSIAYRSWPWSDFHTYAWQDVASIKADCYRGGRGSWKASYVMTMRDGTAIDIMASQRDAARALPTVIRMLHDSDITFDAHLVSRNCGAYGAELLRRRP